ncbi:MAG: PilN domain-containing protein [Myxococcales bacterium]|nr:PilN domain-containing protein [Myxococcales bacterium]
MIRINLLPVRQVKKVQMGQRQLLLFVLLFAVEIVAMFFLYNMASDEVAEKNRIVAGLTTEIDALKKEVGDYDRLQAQRQRLIAQRNIINQLNSARTGPVWLMREMSSILSANGRPTYDQKAYDEKVRRNPSSRINRNWNPRRLWIEQFNERRRSLEIIGKAKDYDDIAEFHKRLNISKYFDNVQLKRNDQVVDGRLGLKVVRFSMTATVKY